MSSAPQKKPYWKIIQNVLILLTVHKKDIRSVDIASGPADLLINRGDGHLELISAEFFFSLHR